MSTYKTTVNKKEITPTYTLEPKDLLKDSDDTYRVYKNGKTYKVVVLNHDSENKKVDLLIDGNKYCVSLADEYDSLLKSLGIEVGGTKKVKNFKAPMPGLVLGIMVEPGQEILKDAPLLILEAMKMENVLKSPGEGVVKSVDVKMGEAVDKNQVLINFE